MCRHSFLVIRLFQTSSEEIRELPGCLDAPIKEHQRADSENTPCNPVNLHRVILERILFSNFTRTGLFVPGERARLPQLSFCIEISLVSFKIAAHKT